MALFDRMKKRSTDSATAIPATPAIFDPDSRPFVAEIAKIAIATLPSSKPEIPDPESKGEAGRTPPGPTSSLPRYSRRKRIKFLGRHSRDVLEGEIIALLPPAPDGTPWYQVRTRNQIVCVSQNHIVEKSHENSL